MQATIITTVVTPADSYALTSRDAVKAELGITDGSVDALLDRYVAGASAAAAQYCNRVFQVEAVSDAIWPAQDPHPWMLSGSFETLQLSRWPVVAVTSVTENGTALVQDTDFRIDAAAGRLFRLDGMGNVMRWNALPKIVAYSAGYQGQGGFGGVPPDVEDAVIRMVTTRYAARGRDRSLKQENIPGVIERSWWISTGSDAGNLTPDITDLLDNYRVPVVG